jgi:small conductance mechanosensitive channel
VVEDLSLRTTRLRDIDGSLHVLTNGSVGTITNYTYKYSSVLVDVIVSYDTDMDIVEKLINEVGTEIAAEEAWQEYTLEPVQFYRVNTFNDSSITVQAIGKTNTAGMQWQVAGEFRRRLHKAFRKHDIPLPYQNIVVREEPKPKQKSTH